MNDDTEHFYANGVYVFQVRLYDTALQRRPAISVDFRESPIKAVAADLNGHDVYIGTGTGDLASFDMRTGMVCCNAAISYPLCYPLFKHRLKA